MNRVVRQHEKAGLTVFGGLDTEFEDVNGSQAARQAQAERKQATIIAVIVFLLFVVAGSISAMPAKGFAKKSELIFTTALIAVVGLGVAVSVKVSLNKKVEVKLNEDAKRFNSRLSQDKPD